MRLTSLPLLVDQPADFRSQPPAEPVVWSRPVAPLAAVFNLEAADELVQRPLSRHMLSVVSGGRRATPGNYTWSSRPIQLGFTDTVRHSTVSRQLRAGSTLIFEALHRTWQPAGELCRRLGYELGVPVCANAYLTPPQAQGFAHHYDTHSVLIVQTAGSKTWQLHEPILRDPLEHQPFRAAELSDEQWQRLREAEPFLQVELRPGDVLWIPRGWIHNGFATDELSLHISVSLASVSRHWLATEIVKQLDSVAALRAELPWGFAADPAVAEAAAAETVKFLMDALAQPIAAPQLDAIADQYGEFFLEAARRPVATSIGEAIEDDTPLGTVAEAVVRRTWTPDGSLRLHLADGILTFTGTSAAAVAELLEADSDDAWTMRQLQDGSAAAGHGRPADARLDEQDARELVETLLDAGIVRRL